MSTKNSKFSGIFAQARQRETIDPEEKQAETETPKAVESVDENVQNPATSAAKTAGTAGKKALQKPGAKGKTPDIPPAIGADKVTESDTITPPIGRPRGKRSDPNFTQITAYISKSTHQNVKMALLNEGQKREISELIEAQLVAWLSQQGG